MSLKKQISDLNDKIEKSTNHLTPQQLGCFELIRAKYLSDKFLTSDIHEIYIACRAVNYKIRKCVDKVLNDFFQLSQDGKSYINDLIEKECDLNQQLLDHKKKVSEGRRIGGRQRWKSRHKYKFIGVKLKRLGFAPVMKNNRVINALKSMKITLNDVKIKHRKNHYAFDLNNISLDFLNKKPAIALEPKKKRGRKPTEKTCMGKAYFLTLIEEDYYDVAKQINPNWDRAWVTKTLERWIDYWENGEGKGKKRANWLGVWQDHIKFKFELACERMARYSNNPNDVYAPFKNSKSELDKEIKKKEEKQMQIIMASPAPFATFEDVPYDPVNDKSESVYLERCKVFKQEKCRRHYFTLNISFHQKQNFPFDVFNDLYSKHGFNGVLDEFKKHYPK